MKTNTIKWRIFKYNLIIILLLIALVSIIFNLAVPLYIKNDTLQQLNKIASRTEDTALRRGPDFFPGPDMPPPEERDSKDIYRYYFMLDRSLREPLSVLNADFILLDQNKKKVSPPFQDEFLGSSAKLENNVIKEIIKIKNLNRETHLEFSLSGTEYLAVVKPVSKKNSFGLGWVIIYSSLAKINQLQLEINLILLSVLGISALITVLLSSMVSRKISAPFSSLNQHIRSIAERNFANKISLSVDDELKELVNNINTMSEKLETYDKAQKTFLQNASHEFRTPLMSIQGYAEGIKHGVVENETAVNVIIDETKRMTHLVENLLYLSRLDTIEENYLFNKLNFNHLINSCMERMNGIAIKNNIKLVASGLDKDILILADEEKLSRAITNIISNCIRYAKNTIDIKVNTIDKNSIEIIISDDGPGIAKDELPNIFDRFYKGKKGNFGLGLAISKNVIEKHAGKITAENSETGALFKIELPVSEE